MMFLKQMKAQYPRAFRCERVLECGSYNVNGTPRGLFQVAEYIGLDWRPGPGVDVVGLVHEWPGRPDEYFDTIVSTEMLEHDPHWRESLKRMSDLLASGGYMLLTAAGPGRGPHDVEVAPDGRHYRTLTLADLRAVLPLQILHASNVGGDLQYAGRKP